MGAPSWTEAPRDGYAGDRIRGGSRGRRGFGGEQAFSRGRSVANHRVTGSAVPAGRERLQPTHRASLGVSGQRPPPVRSESEPSRLPGRRLDSSAWGAERREGKGRAVRWLRREAGSPAPGRPSGGLLLREERGTFEFTSSSAAQRDPRPLPPLPGVRGTKYSAAEGNR